jgi:hypothetical protein
MTAPVYPLGAGSEPEQVEDTTNPEQPRMPPVNSDNYQGAMSAAKGEEIKGSPKSSGKASDVHDDDDEDENDDRPSKQPPKPSPKK